jgi:hypothetical protein
VQTLHPQHHHRHAQQRGEYCDRLVQSAAHGGILSDADGFPPAFRAAVRRGAEVVAAARAVPGARGMLEAPRCPGHRQ